MLSVISTGFERHAWRLRAFYHLALGGPVTGVCYCLIVPSASSRRDPIRVLYYYPATNFDSGSPRALAAFIEGLDQTAVHPLFLAVSDGPLLEALRGRGAEILRGTAGSISYRRPFAALAAVRRQMAHLKAWKIDILHANDIFWNTDLILAAGLLRIPVVLHVHNPSVVHFQNMERFAARKVLFCSRFEMGNCRHFGRIRHKAEAFHNAIDVAALGRGTPIRASLGVREGTIAIGTVAQIGRRKGIDILIETARILLRERTDLVFLVAGPPVAGEEEFANQLRAAAEAPGLRGRVQFLGSRSDIPDFLASLDLFVLPTRAEPFGIVIIEAMAAGIPVIASKVGGIPEILSSPEIGRLVEPVSPDAFANAIREILASAGSGRSMGENGRRSVARFDARIAGERLHTLYLELLRRGVD